MNGHIRSRRDYGQGEWISREQVAEICPTCAEKMDDKGMSRVRASVLKKAMIGAGMSSKKVASLLRTARKMEVGDFIMQGANDEENTTYAIIVGPWSSGGWKVVKIQPWRGIAAVGSSKGWYPAPFVIRRNDVPSNLLRKLERKAEPYLQEYREKETSERMSSRTAYRNYRNMRGDPRWMKSRYPGVAIDGTQFERGDEILYWPRMPRGKNIMVGEQATAAWEQFQSEAADEEFLSPSRYSSDGIVSALLDVAEELSAK